MAGVQRFQPLTGLFAHLRRFLPGARLWYMVYYSYQDRRASLPPLPDVTYRRVLLGDPCLPQFVDFDEWQWAKSIQDVERALREGHELYAAFVGDRLASYCWMTTHVEDPYYGRPVALGPDEFYMDAAFTAPGFRGRGILPRLMLWMVDDVERRLHKRHLVALMIPLAGPYIRVVKKMGARHIGYMGYAQLLGLRLHLILTRYPVFQPMSRVALTAVPLNEEDALPTQTAAPITELAGAD